MGPEGIYILSTMRKKTELKLIWENEVKEIPFPEDEMKEKLYVCSSKILCLGNELYLFYKNDDGLFCSKYDGKDWSQCDRFEDEGNYKALLFKDGILLFQMDFCKRQNITLRAYSKNSWSEPKTVNIPGTSLHFDLMPAVFAERPILYRQGFFYEKYYSIDEGQVSGPFKISSPFFFSLGIWKIVLITILPAAIYFLLAFLLSFFIGKFKMKRWRIDSKEYEFASLWRRFLANYIDTLILEELRCEDS